MKILEKLKSLLPISRKEHKAEIEKIYKRQRNALVHREAEYQRKEQELTKTVAELVHRLSRVRFLEHQYPKYAVQIEISADMMRYAHDPKERQIIADMLGQRVAAEIRASRFVQ